MRELREWSAPDQSFNIKVDAEPTMATGYDRYRTEFRAGERVTFRIATEKPAYLMLLDIDKDGRVNVLFPGPDPGDQALRKASDPVQFDVVATAPAGAEQLKLIGFADRPADWGLWACSAHRCPSFTPGEASMSELMDFLRRSHHVSEASLKVVTTE